MPLHICVQECSKDFEFNEVIFIGYLPLYSYVVVVRFDFGLSIKIDFFMKDICPRCVCFRFEKFMILQFYSSFICYFFMFY